MAVLDETLKRLNSDYEAKRYNNFYPPKVRRMPQGTFITGYAIKIRWAVGLKATPQQHLFCCRKHA